jgi:hypothetical protein
MVSSLLSVSFLIALYHVNQGYHRLPFTVYAVDFKDLAFPVSRLQSPDASGFPFTVDRLPFTQLNLWILPSLPPVSSFLMPRF